MKLGQIYGEQMFVLRLNNCKYNPHLQIGVLVGKIIFLFSNKTEYCLQNIKANRH